MRSFSIQNDNPSFILVDPDSLDERSKETIRENLQKFPSAKLLDAKIANQLSKVMSGRPLVGARDFSGQILVVKF